MTQPEFIKMFTQYMGFPPSSKDYATFAMKSSVDTEDILKNTKSNVQSGAVNKAKSAISALSGGMAQGPEKDYLEQVAGGYNILQEQLGIPEAGKRLEESEAFLKGIQQRGPIFEEVMKSGLGEVSPTFLGATRKDLEEKLSGIGNPFVRDKMINSYLDAADKSMAANLTALNGLYQTALIGAQTAVEADQKHYDKIMGNVKDLFSELQWINRKRYIEQTEGPSVVDIRNQQEAYQGELIALQQFENRKTALNYLEQNSTYFISVMGENNYKRLFTELDRIHPEISEVKKTAEPLISPTAFKAGKETKGFLGRVKEAITKPFVEKIGEPALKVEDFFKGLFAE